VTDDAWNEESRGGILVFRPGSKPPGILLAVSARASAPDGSSSPTAFLARRLAEALDLPDIPIVRATQVHGTAAVVVSERPPAGSVLDAGECDILATTLPGVALAVQTADCVPVVLAGPEAVGVAHAGWRGSARNAAGSAVDELSRLGVPPWRMLAWLGPSIGPCCYEVGGEVAAQFAGGFARRSCNGRYTLDLAAVNRAQIESAGVPAANITAHPSCTRCGGEKFASYRRDGAAAGRMITLAALLRE
jgi:YfiH family protein